MCKQKEETAAHLGDGGGVGDHADGALDLGQVTARDNCGGLVVDAALEAGGAPVHKLDGALGLDGRYGRVHVLGHHISAVHEAARHVLRASRACISTAYSMRFIGMPGRPRKFSRLSAMPAEASVQEDNQAQVHACHVLIGLITPHPSGDHQQDV